jgi:50S ribosomal protein L16 3-hydroxylase
VLLDWLAPMDLATFCARHLKREPLASPGAAHSALPLLQWDTIARVLRSDRPLDLVTVKGGRLVDAAVPRSIADVDALMGRGVSVVIRGSEQHDAGLAAIAAAFAEALSAEVHVQLYATPAATNSFGWHYDFEDVFIAQTAGIKDYYFRDNTVARQTRLGETLDFEVVRQETSPLYTARLLPADWLYIPARWWHLVKCVESSLSISVGAMSRDELRAAVRLPRGWSDGRRP